VIEFRDFIQSRQQNSDVIHLLKLSHCTGEQLHEDAK
jgi:hypothetical protein